MDERIDRLQRRSAQDAGVICLAGGLPSKAQFPRRRLAEAFLRAIEEPGATALQYGWPEGIAPLRAWIAARLERRRLAVTAEQVIVTSGAQQAIAIAASLALDEGERIGVDAESYPAALDAFRTRGLRPVTDEDVSARYVMPAVHNPRGTVLGAAARRRLIASGATLLEDDAYADLRFDGAPGPPLAAAARDRVWYLGTLSKTLCPGLRLGWLVPPPERLDEALRHKRDDDLQAASLTQAVVADFLARDDFEARLASERRFYAARARRLFRAVRRWLPGFRCALPEGGFSLWLEAPPAQADGDDADFLQVALAHGVGFDPGRLFRASGRSAPLALRVCFSLEPPARLDEGMRRLAQAWRAFTARATVSAR